jgi:hypothetical protein
MRNVSDKSCRENQNTYFTLTNFLEHTALYEITGGKYGTARQAKGGKKKTCRMRTARRVSKARNIHREYVILVAFLRQQFSSESVSVSRYTTWPALFGSVRYVATS